MVIAIFAVSTNQKPASLHPSVSKMGNAFGSPTKSLPGDKVIHHIKYIQTKIQEEPSMADLENLSNAFDIQEPNDWKSKLGFQNEIPLKDVRGGGKLAVLNLEYFCTNPQFCDRGKSIAASRSNRENGKNYPFATAGINMTRQLAIYFEIVTAGGNVSHTIQHTQKSYWNFLVQDSDDDNNSAAAASAGADDNNSSSGTQLLEQFNIMYCLFFMVMDSSFTRCNAGYMDFPVVMKDAQARFEKLLIQAKNVSHLQELVNHAIE
jgi:hypothetical protein